LEFNIIGVGKNEYSNSNSNFTNTTDLPFVVGSSTWTSWDAGQRDLIFLDKNGEFFCNINISSGFNEEDILEKISHLHWNTTAILDIQLDLDDSDNIFVSGSIHPINISIINNSFFDAQYAGYLLSSNSPNIQFGNISNWFYVLPEGEIGFDTTNLIISDNALVGDEIILYAEPSHINECSDCNECDIECLNCHIGGASQISFIISENQLIGDINLDNTVNVVDIVVIVNLILSGDNSNELADINNDGQIDVVDIVQLVNLILN
tara:strand:- start:1434 stop:2225 length:792 start_codon:yes stop_codon:yes gene_type:complete